MENPKSRIFFISCLTLLCLLSTDHPAALPGTHALLLPIVPSKTETYIVHVERPLRHELLDDEELERWHRSFLPNTTLASGEPRLLYSYSHVISGFAARFSPEELDAVKSMVGFIHAQPNEFYQPDTTYTPGYLGLSDDNGWAGTMQGESIVIAIIDTGITPTHPSFHDRFMPPPPPKFKGNCSTAGFRCTNKIVAAKAFHGGLNPSPIDTNGHGTHVAGTAAGSPVHHANVLGQANGTASGTAPLAHLAIYKVCFPRVGCGATDQLAAMDQAMKDEVDIISMSISGNPRATLYSDVISRGGMQAFKKGIVTVAAAGNSGPGNGTVNHCAPWVLTVGAASTDRRIVAVVELGDGRTFPGESAYQPSSFNSSKKLQLEYPGKQGSWEAECCHPSSLSSMNLRGKIVLCSAGLIEDIEKGEAVYAAGAEAMIVMNLPYQGYTTFSEAHVLPVARVNYVNGVDILDYYLNNQSAATGTIRFNGTNFGFRPAPAVAYFSSRGPGRMNGGVIKPDIVAPGVNILAAWPKAVGPNPSPLATRNFNFESGTSMAAPHVSGIAALVRSQHRDWTPSEINSAITTTANDSTTAAGDLIVDQKSNQTAWIYTMGAGMVNPVRAMDPGLVYDITLDDYKRYVCSLGYNDRQATLTIGEQTKCSQVKKVINASELNYPSISVNLTLALPSMTVRRTAKNVGDDREVYRANITEPAGVNIYLSTYELKFTRKKQEISYDVTLATSLYPGTTMVKGGKIVWNSGKHVVTNPIAVWFQ
ncbi:Subtilisin-like protease SDD1 [Apostasia shenzhenica]|uniref:Subtilisin-like protease SDD1 n=1 Tax=Apostasia shenzhenica TaxID=1088818 RepID=A0A2I0B9P8_9ASPA|nr:Subtilisin-like protease SDD1 [Apostasia shenzhenica]